MSQVDVARTAKAALRVEETCASACLRALRCLFDTQWLSWEPETVWLELHHMGVDVPVGNRNQIMAGRSLITTGRFWYDATAFEAACIAFNNDEPTFFGIEDAPVAYINWAVYEADRIHKDFENEVLEFDREPIAYTAVQLYREGFVIAPEHLEMAQEELNKALPTEVKALQKLVREGWATAPRGQALLDAAFPETPAGVQLARLAAVQLHFDRRLRILEEQILPFKSC
jgi:hypothetical protein